MSTFKKTSGFLLINKPAASAGRPSGPTSHDVIDQLRRITGVRQIGHAGTLDPFASGLLLVGVGEATKLLRHYVGLDKKYVATLRLGAVSDTYDRTGKIKKIQGTRCPAMRRAGKIQTNSKLQIQKILKSFVGKQKQVPPMYSAKKVGGRKLYELARAGKEINREPADIEIYDLRLIAYDYPLLTIYYRVSSGTYIRSLTHDIGARLGTGAYLEELQRTAIGEFKLKDSIPIVCHTGAERQRGDIIHFGKHSLDSIASPADSAGSLQNDINKNNWQKYLIPVKIVLVSGTFDGVHEGHRDYFRQARQYGQKLIAIVARDLVSKKFKSRPPRYSEKERIKMVKESPEIDQVFLGVPDDSPPAGGEVGGGGRVFDFVASLAPDIIALGYDQTAYTQNLAKEMRKRGLKVKIVRLRPHSPEKYKSSLINPQGVDKNLQKS